jgi:hypothetical protein
MPSYAIPALDANYCSGWNEQDINLYNKLDFYFAKMQVEMKKGWPLWSKLLGKIRWQPNMGNTMRGVTKMPSPHLRQFAVPSPILNGTLPKKDILDVRERKEDVTIYRHRFESQIMNFIPSFRDFFKDHVSAHSTDIAEKQLRYDDIYIRGNIFHQAPFVFLPDSAQAAGSLIDAPYGVGDDAGRSEANGYQSSNTAKTKVWLQAKLAEIGTPGNLSFNALNLLLTIMENDLRIPYYSGSDMPKDDAGLSGKYVLICSGEAWNQFLYDPWMLANKPIDMDVVHNGWKGSFFGRITTKIEDLPLRISADGTFPNPQTREVNPNAYNYQETINNPAYNNAPYEVAFLAGAQGYDSIEIGPPPSPFAGGMPDGFGKMIWNGEIVMTKNILIPCTDDRNQLTYDTNNYGEYLKLISQVTYGIMPKQRRNIIPIIFQRKRGA